MKVEDDSLPINPYKSKTAPPPSQGVMGSHLRTRTENVTRE